jgi:sugar phosphate isomerase/epimerase
MAKETKREAADKPTFQLGLASYTTRKLSVDATLKIAKRLGLEQVCFKSFHLPLDSSQQEIDKVLAKVKKAGLTLYGGGTIVMENEKQVRQAFEYGRMAGMKRFICFPHPPMLDLVEEMVKKYDIQIAIHNHGPEDHFYRWPEKTYEMLKGRDPRIGFCIDIGHVTRVGGDPAKSIEVCADRLFDLHMKDVSKSTSKGKTVPCGHGVIDLPAVLATLKKIGYKYNASFEIECFAKDPIPSLAESVGYIRGLLVGA